MNKALLVIDVQEDYFSENRNKKKLHFQNPALLIQNINTAIEKYKIDGYEIIYIAEILPDLFTNRLVFGFSIKGTEGAKLVKGLNILSDNYFEKQLPNSFSNKQLCKLIKEKNIEEVVLCGIDEAGCVKGTAKGGIKLGLNVKIIKDAVDTVFDNRRNKIRENLNKLGVKYI